MSNWKFEDKDKCVDLDTCIKWVNDIHSEQSEYIDIIHRDEDTFLGRVHHGLGQWIRNNLGLWTKDSPAGKWFNKNGIYHPDDMSSIILLSAYRTYHNQDIKLDEQIKHYRDFWEERAPEVNKGIFK